MSATETEKRASIDAKMDVVLEATWKQRLLPQFYEPYMKKLRAFLKRTKKTKVVYPPGKEIFNAMNLTPFNQVSVVILGQDPYHGPRQAHGFCFSVQPGIALPPSLKNIFKEMNDDLSIDNGDHGCLIPWAKQGVLLLNSVLTVEKHQAASHQGQGWETFTDAVIRHVNDELEDCVFMLWGNYAQRKGGFIDSTKHLVLKAPHPSPLSAHRGFLGCRHFSITNHYLKSRGKKPIQWALPSKKEMLKQLEVEINTAESL